MVDTEAVQLVWIFSPKYVGPSITRKLDPRLTIDGGFFDLRWHGSNKDSPIQIPATAIVVYVCPHEWHRTSVLFLTRMFFASRVHLHSRSGYLPLSLVTPWSFTKRAAPGSTTFAVHCTRTIRPFTASEVLWISTTQQTPCRDKMSGEKRPR